MIPATMWKKPQRPKIRLATARMDGGLIATGGTVSSPSSTGVSTTATCSE